MLQDEGKTMPRPKTDIAGRRFNMLVALREAEPEYHTWVFQCDCGARFVARKHNVVYGNTKSCGCLRRKHTSAPKVMPENEARVAASEADSFWHRLMWDRTPIATHARRLNCTPVEVMAILKEHRTLSHTYHTPTSKFDPNKAHPGNPPKHDSSSADT